MFASEVNPEHSLLEQDDAVYQVHFWSRPGGEDRMWCRHEWRLQGAKDLPEVLAWADCEAAGRHFTLYVAAMVDDELSLPYLRGDDPTRLPSRSVQLQVVLRAGVNADTVAAVVAAAGQSGRYALTAAGSRPWRAIWQMPVDDPDGVAEALASRLRDEGYEATVTHWE